ncbi:MAG: RNA-binding S4 domain-containing protein [Rhizobiales bacterium]|nr:RNA-binding S4 domain-containing protein [Rhizobacter sp.]
MNVIDFPLRGEHITLDALLKATGLAPSGGMAKRMIAEGLVQVDGRDESRKTCKIRAGQVVSLHGTRVSVLAPLAD